MDRDEFTRGVLLGGNSPGGTVDSTKAFADTIRAVNAVKPVVTWTPFAASAALFVASQSREIWVEDQRVGGLGFIGVLMVLTNQSKALEKQGIEVAMMWADGSHEEALVNGVEPISDLTRAELQATLYGGRARSSRMRSSPAKCTCPIRRSKWAWPTPKVGLSTNNLTFQTIMTKTTKPVTAMIAALFPKSEKALSEALGTEQFNAFAEDAQEVQNWLDAQAEGNQAAANDLTAAHATRKDTQDQLTAAEGNLKTANKGLTAANTRAHEAKAKADQWDAYQALLKGTQMGRDTTTGIGKDKPAPSRGLSVKDKERLNEKQRLAKTYPSMMADLGITVDAE